MPIIPVVVKVVTPWHSVLVFKLTTIKYKLEKALTVNDALLLKAARRDAIAK